MADNKTSTFSVVYAVLGGILVPMVLIALVAKFFIVGPAAEAEEPVPVAEAVKVEQNIEPVAEVVVASAEDEAPAAEKTGEEVVKAVCAMCHGTGLMSAPKIGSDGDWAPRIAKGYDTLVQNAINGINSMPAKGGNPGLSDAEVARAVAHMANQAGADFKAP